VSGWWGWLWRVEFLGFSPAVFDWIVRIPDSRYDYDDKKRDILVIVFYKNMLIQLTHTYKKSIPVLSLRSWLTSYDSFDPAR
jgi:hypothetical protein